MLDFSDDPAVHLVDEVAAQTLARGFEGRVAVGHMTTMAQRVLGRPPAGITAGAPADLVVLEAGVPSDAVLAAPATTGVIRHGRWRATAPVATPPALA